MDLHPRQFFRVTAEQPGDFILDEMNEATIDRDRVVAIYEGSRDVLRGTILTPALGRSIDRFDSFLADAHSTLVPASGAGSSAATMTESQ